MPPKSLHTGSIDDDRHKMEGAPDSFRQRADFAIGLVVCDHLTCSVHRRYAPPVVKP